MNTSNAVIAANSRWDERNFGGGRDSANEPPDYCSQSGAAALKARIEAYWRERGHNVMISLHNVGFHPAIRAARYDVRSDMVNGMPRPAAGGAKPAQPQPEADYDDGAEDDFD